MRHEDDRRQPWRRRLAEVACASLVVGSVVGGVASTAGATEFTSGVPIQISGQGGASPYPSTISLSSAPGPIADVDVTLHGFWQNGSTEDVDVLLVSPGGVSVILMADVAGGPNASPGGVLTFDDAAASSLAAPFSTGTYKPTNAGAFSDASQLGPYATTLSVLNGTPRGGTWKLFVYDDALHAYNYGGIDGGWGLDVTTLQITSLTPSSGPVGTSVKIGGTGFTGATAVKFNGHAATAFSVDSDTQITATVPAGATTGPVSVATASGSAQSEGAFVVTVSGLTSVIPRSGEVGDTVTVNGVGLSGATAVTFKNVAATTFRVISDSKITAKVPTGASTGRISVSTPNGIARSARFIVRHARTVSAHRVGDKVKGRVRATDAFGACGKAVPVKVQLRVGSGWQTVAGIFTKAHGSFTASHLDEPGAYRAVAKRTKLASGDVCLKDVSPAAR